MVWKANTDIHQSLCFSLLCRAEREERGAKGPLEALTDTLKGAADFVK